MWQIYTQGEELSQKKLAKLKNNLSFQNTFSRLALDALKRFKLEGQPDSISERVFLQSLLWYGSAVIFEKDGSLLCLPGVPTGAGFNIYGDPGECWVFSATGQLSEPVKTFLPGSDEAAFLKRTMGTQPRGEVRGVYVRENRLAYPFIRLVIQYAEAIADTMRTLDVARQTLKSPYIVVAEESVVPTVKQFFKNRDNNEAVIVSSGIFPVDKISLLPIETSCDVLSAAIETIEWYEGKFRQLCGVDSNSQIDKKGENLISDELQVDAMYTDLCVSSCVEVIQESLDQVNRIFGTSLKIHARREEVDRSEDVRGDRSGTTTI